MHNDNWDDLRFVLAVADVGTVSGAARKLNVNHATVLRRISGFEARHGLRLFDKSAQGYKILPDRQRIVDAMREVEVANRAIELMMQGTQAPLSGILRVTSTDTLCQAVLPGILARLRQEAADLKVQLLSSNAHLDLSRLHADIAVRPAEVLPDDLSGEVAAILGFDVYAAPGAPDLWLGVIGALSRSVVASWMAREVPEDQRTAASDSFLVLREMAAAGQGQAILPCCLGDPDPRLERRRGIIDDFGVSIWVASYSDLADVQRIVALRGRIAEELRAIAPMLAGH